MKHKITLLFVALISTITFAQKQINFNTKEGIYPEGIAYYPQKDAFLVSSITKGQIGIVDRQGNYSVFLDNNNFYSSVGLKVKGDKLYVAVGDLGLSNRSKKTTPKTIARLLIFNLNTKKLLKKIDLHKQFKGAHWANDLFVNDAGEIYITDSFSPIIYKVTAKGKTEVFLKDDNFKGEGVNLNGIIEHPDGYLLVAKSSDGKLFKVDINTKKVTEVQLSTPIIGMDGLLLLPDGGLLIGQNTAKEAYHKVVSTNNFKSAYVLASDTKNLDFATTATLANGEAYFLNSHITDLFKGKNDRKTFFIRKFNAVYVDKNLVQQININTLKTDVFSDKISRKVIPSNNGTFGIYKLKKGAHIPKHDHPQQQTTYIRSGKVRIIIGDNEEHILSAGDVIVIPGNVKHEFFILEDTEDIDIFSPKRDENWILGKSKFLKKSN